MYKIIGANQTEYGPVSAEQIRQWIAEGRVNAQTLAQAEGETGWKPISQFPEFSASFAATPPPFGAGGPVPGAPGIPPFGDTSAAQSKVSGPAIGIIVVGALNILIALAALGYSLMQGNANPHSGNPEFDKMFTMMSGPINILLRGIEVLIGAFIIFGGIKMKKLEAYGLSMAAAIIAMLPCLSSCCLIGIPFGIWAIIVLNKPEVKSAFK